MKNHITKKLPVFALTESNLKLDFFWRLSINIYGLVLRSLEL